MARGFAPMMLVSTDAVEPDPRFEHWRRICRDFAEIEPEPQDRADFAIRAETWRLGPFTLTEATTSGMRLVSRASPCSHADADFWIFGLSLGPTWSTVRDDRAERVGPGRLWLMRTSRPSMTLAPSGRYVLLTLPTDASAELTAGLSRFGGGELPGPGPALLGDILAALPARLRATPEAELGRLSDAFRAIVANCLLGELPPAEVRELAAGPLLRERVLGLIRQHIGSARLDVERICRLAGISRSVLYRMFEGEGGVASLVRDMRLHLVLADLQDPALADIPIFEIAERRGLHNAPSFSRTFRRAFGRSPSEVRAAAAFGLPSPAFVWAAEAPAHAAERG